jgi:N-acetylglutamate synthase-like GNAT family acetyltransferase
MFNVRPINESDRSWLQKFVLENWKAKIVVAHGAIYKPHTLQGFVAEISPKSGKKTVGLVTYVMQGDSCEIITIDSLVEKQRIGTALLQKVVEVARAASCKRV